MVAARPYLWPAAFLAAVTMGAFGLRAALHHSPGAAKPPAVVEHAPAARYYRVRAGDTLAAVAARTGVSATRLLKLNPGLQPTALFLGQKIRLR